MSLDGSEFPQKGNLGSTAKIYRRRRSGRVGAKGGEADSALAGEDRLALRGKRWGKGLHDGRGGVKAPETRRNVFIRNGSVYTSSRRRQEPGSRSSLRLL